MLRLYDTLARRKRKFKPLRDNLVRIYTCGPSVYAYSHIGNFRTYLFEDVLVRYLKYKGYRVRRAMNITDVEDKAILAAKKEDVSLAALENEKLRRFFADYDALGMLRPDIVAHASRHVPDMARLIGRICTKGYCRIDKDGIYFDVRKFRRYGALAHLKNRTYLGVARKDDYAKEGLWDFRLWKFWTKDDGKVRWRSPFGNGRPGWHIECSAMAMKYLGESFDIHCGGVDNIHPHHENEIAQSEAATGKRLANFWMHCRHLTVGKRKMSKRTGNVVYVRQLLEEGVHPRCLRFYLISHRYRSRLDFTLRKFEFDSSGYEHLRHLIARLRKHQGKGDGKTGALVAARLLAGFESAMDDDLDTRLALKRIFAGLREAESLMKAKRLSRKDAREIAAAMDRIDSVLGVF